MKYCYLTNTLWVLLILVFSSTPLVIAGNKDDVKVSHNASFKPLIADTDKHVNNTNPIQLKTKPTVKFIRKNRRNGEFNEDSIKFDIGDKLNFFCDVENIPIGSYLNLMQIKGTTNICRIKAKVLKTKRTNLGMPLDRFRLNESDDGTIIYCHVEYMENNDTYGLITSKPVRLVLKSNMDDDKFTQKYTAEDNYTEHKGILSMASSVRILLILVIAASLIVVLLLVLIIRKCRARRALQKENETAQPEYEEIPIMSFDEARNLLVSNKKISPNSSAPAPSSAPQYDDHYSYAYGIRPKDEILSV